MDVDAELEGSLLRAFSHMGTDDKESLVAQFQRIINEGQGGQISESKCLFYLEMTNWNLQEALGAYCDFAQSEREPPRMTLKNDDTYVFVPSPSASGTIPIVPEAPDLSPGSGSPGVNLPGNWLEHKSIEMPPLTRFAKHWTLINSGPESWPSNCYLQFVAGEPMHVNPRIPLDTLTPSSPSPTPQAQAQASAFPPPGLHFPHGPQQAIEVRIEFIAPPRPGDYSARWRLFAPNNQPFGDTIWVLVSVRGDEQLEGMVDRLSRITTGDGEMSEGSPVMPAPTPILPPFPPFESKLVDQNPHPLSHPNQLLLNPMEQLSLNFNLATTPPQASFNPFAVALPKPVPAQPPPTPTNQSPVASPSPILTDTQYELNNLNLNARPNLPIQNLNLAQGWGVPEQRDTIQEFGSSSLYLNRDSLPAPVQGEHGQWAQSPLAVYLSPVLPQQPSTEDRVSSDLSHLLASMHSSTADPQSPPTLATLASASSVTYPSPPHPHSHLHPAPAPGALEQSNTSAIGLPLTNNLGSLSSSLALQAPGTLNNPSGSVWNSLGNPPSATSWQFPYPPAPGSQCYPPAPNRTRS